MQTQPSQTPADDDNRADSTILGLLLAEPALWSLDEVAREYGDETATTDALARLHGHGLVHRLGAYVFPTRAAVEFARVEW
jgi:hypothetical protein